MTIQTFSRLQLAENQLETAIGLFVSGRDRFSVITLAGAADVILCRLVLNLGKENFTDAMIHQSEEERISKEKRASYGREINDTLHINDLKHMDAGEDGYVEMDIEECALAAILKALANCVQIVGHERDYIKGFLAWVRLNLDPNKYNIYSDPNWKGNT
jgi:hypothetical protein